MRSSLITEAELMQWLKCNRRGDLKRVMKKHGINTITGVDGTIVTTLEAINQVLWVRAAQEQYYKEHIGGKRHGDKEPD